MIRHPPISTRPDTLFPSATRFLSQGLATGEDRVPAARPDGHLPQQFPPAVRAGFAVLRLLFRPARHRPLLPAVRSPDGTLAAGVARTHPGDRLRVDRRRPGRQRQATAGILRAVVGSGLPGIRYQPSPGRHNSEEHTYELRSLMRTSYAVLCLKK